MFEKIEAIIDWDMNELLADKEKAIQLISKFDIFDENEVVNYGIILKNTLKKHYLVVLPNIIQIVAFEIGSFQSFSEYAEVCINGIANHLNIISDKFNTYLIVTKKFSSGRPFFNRLTASTKKLAYLGDEVSPERVSFSVSINKRSYGLSLLKRKKGLDIKFSVRVSGDIPTTMTLFNEIKAEIEGHLIPELAKATKSRRE